MSIMGIKFKIRQSPLQGETLSEWMGGDKFIWNAKCDEDKYLRTFAKKYLPTGTFPKLDQQYSQYKTDGLSDFLNNIPSQVLRNSCSNWYASYQQFFKRKDVGRPRRKKKGQGMSIHLTRELFEFKNTSEGLKLFIGTKTNNIGFLDVIWHDLSWMKHGLPNSLRIKKLPCGTFTVSFCYDDDSGKSFEQEQKEWFRTIQENWDQEKLEKEILGIDRGITVAVATDKELIPFAEKAKAGMSFNRKKLKKEQVKFARKKLGSNRRNKQRIKVSKTHKKISNIRDNQCHHISKQLATSDHKIFILEDLKQKNMTKSAKGTSEKHGKNVRAKAGLNREILNVGWYKIETQLKYKAKKLGKTVFKINPRFTSQECANCGHTHSDNRHGINFMCMECGHQDHADINAAKVIKKRAVKLLMDSGTELAKTGVLAPAAVANGRRGTVRPGKGKPIQAGPKTSKRKRSVKSMDGRKAV